MSIAAVDLQPDDYAAFLAGKAVAAPVDGFAVDEADLNPALAFDIVDRLIDRYSGTGDLVYDPFGGLMTVPYRALLKGRRGGASELSAAYFDDGVRYLRAAEARCAMPGLFDVLDAERDGAE